MSREEIQKVENRLRSLRGGLANDTDKENVEMADWHIKRAAEYLNDELKI